MPKFSPADFFAADILARGGARSPSDSVESFFPHFWHASC
jgi:hypothetical protein